MLIFISQNCIAFIGILIVLTIFIFRILIMNLNVQKTISDKYKFEFMKLLFGIYGVLLISRVFFPITIGIDDSLSFNSPEIWLSPIWSIKQYFINGGFYWMIYMIVGNFLLLLPLGFFVGYFKDSKYKRVKEALIFCFKASLFIETSQLLISILIPNTVRFFEINDIILNTIGGGVGFYIHSKFKNK